MQVRIESLPGGIDRLQADLLKRIDQPLVDQLNALGVIAIGGFHFQGALEIVHHRQQFLNQIHRRELHEVGALALATPARVVEFGAGTQQAVFQVGLGRGESIAFRRQPPFYAFDRQIPVLGHFGIVMFWVWDFHYIQLTKAAPGLACAGLRAPVAATRIARGWGREISRKIA